MPKPLYFYLQLPYVSVCMNGSTEGNCNQDLCCLWLSDLYAPQCVDLGEGGSFSYWCLSDWPELHAV